MMPDSTGRKSIGIECPIQIDYELTVGLHVVEVKGSRGSLYCTQLQSPSP